MRVTGTSPGTRRAGGRHSSATHLGNDSVTASFPHKVGDLARRRDGERVAACDASEEAIKAVVGRLRRGGSEWSAPAGRLGEAREELQGRTKVLFDPRVVVLGLFDLDLVAVDHPIRLSTVPGNGARRTEFQLRARAGESREDCSRHDDVLRRGLGERQAGEEGTAGNRERSLGAGVGRREGRVEDGATEA